MDDKCLLNCPEIAVCSRRLSSSGTNLYTISILMVQKNPTFLCKLNACPFTQKLQSVPPFFLVLERLNDSSISQKLWPVQTGFLTVVYKVRMQG